VESQRPHQWKARDPTDGKPEATDGIIDHQRN